ncbi:uncharacterized protein LOC116952244 isoform X1 [Petromyzon marinus]|uniref:uncharacterized protein LOC116952244 isoform X1 n=1 Tax=Petromyzon marinus TaxID=7757 RepID=UPI003F6FDE1F
MNGHRSSSRKGKVETAVSSLIEVFHRYAGEDGDDLSLSVTELRSLIRHELPTMSQHCQSQQAMDNLMRSLDANGDGTIDFSEYMTFLNKFTILIDDFYIRSLLRNQAISLKASTAIEEALYGLVEAFHKHAGSSGDPFKLNKQEFKNLLQTEMPTLHEVTSVWDMAPGALGLAVPGGRGFDSISRDRNWDNVVGKRYFLNISCDFFFYNPATIQKMLVQSPGAGR